MYISKTKLAFVTLFLLFIGGIAIFAALRTQDDSLELEAATSDDRTVVTVSEPEVSGDDNLNPATSLGAADDRALAAASASDATEGQNTQPVNSQSSGISSEITACDNPTVHSANSSNLSTVFEDVMQGCHVINLAPGNYGLQSYSTGEVASENHLTLYCEKTHECVFDQLQFTWYDTVIVDGITAGGVNVPNNIDYALMLFYGRAAQIKNVHVDTSLSSGPESSSAQTHGISFKNYVGRAEIIDSEFDCLKHCLELTQNGNIPGRNSVVGVGVVSGNRFAHGLGIEGVAIINRNICEVHIDNNIFETSSASIMNSPYWAEYTGSPVLVPKCPLVYNSTSRDQGQDTNPIGPINTRITNNTFNGGKVIMKSLGVNDDWIHLKDNQGSFTCSLDEMNSDAANAHADEQTTGPPKLATGSDPCS